MRLTGIVTTLHMPEHPDYGGSYGTILTDDRKVYVWSSGSVFRNFSKMDVGVRCWFDEIGCSYATNISTIESREKKA